VFALVASFRSAAPHSASPSLPATDTGVGCATGDGLTFGGVCTCGVEVGFAPPKKHALRAPMQFPSFQFKGLSPPSFAVQPPLYISLSQLLTLVGYGTGDGLTFIGVCTCGAEVGFAPTEKTRPPRTNAGSVFSVEVINPTLLHHSSTSQMLLHFLLRSAAPLRLPAGSCRDW
jgi:hypothetical protein